MAHKRTKPAFFLSEAPRNIPKVSWWVGKKRTFYLRAALERHRIKNSKHGRGHTMNIVGMGRYATRDRSLTDLNYD